MDNRNYYQQESRTDVFKSYLVKKAEYAGKFEIPCLHRTSRLIPKKLVTFSKALNSKEYDAWIVFYEHDEAFIRIWRNPRKYLQVLKKFRGVFSPVKKVESVQIPEL